MKLGTAYLAITTFVNMLSAFFILGLCQNYILNSLSNVTIDYQFSITIAKLFSFEVNILTFFALIKIICLIVIFSISITYPVVQEKIEERDCFFKFPWTKNFRYEAIKKNMVAGLIRVGEKEVIQRIYLRNKKKISLLKKSWAFLFLSIIPFFNYIFYILVIDVVTDNIKTFG